MSDNNSDTGDTRVPEELQGLGATLSEGDVHDKELIVKVGIRLEQAWTYLRVNGGGKVALECLKACLQALQNLYQDQLKDPQGTWQAVGLGVQAVEDQLHSGGDGEELVAAALEALQASMSSEASAPEDNTQPPEQADAAEDAAPVESADADDANPPQGQNDPRAVLQSLEDIAARLVSQDPSAGEELSSLRDELVSLSGAAGLSAAAVGHLTLAAQTLETVVSGRAENSAKDIEQAGKVVGQAIEAQESSIESSPEVVATDVPATESEEDAQAESEPDPAAETPAETAEETAERPEAKSAENASAGSGELPKVEFPGPAVMPDDSDGDLLNEYVIESLDHITNAEGSLLELESNPEDREQIDVVFRAYHTIKGTSGFLGFDRIQKLAHLAENLLDRAREGEVRIAGGFADLCLRSCDHLRTMIEGLRGVEPGGTLPVPDDLDELLGILTDPEGAGYSSEDRQDESLRVGDILVGQGNIPREKIEEVEKSKGDKRIGEALVESGAASPAQVADAIRTQRKIQQGQGSEGSVRVATGRLDSLINMVGELVIAQSMVSADPDVTQSDKPRLQRNVSHAGKIIRELQDLTMSLRMVPLKSVFQKMNRLVRDLARKSHKKVQFVTEGEDTEIDRNMVESLNDPLVHMIRNSVDHGIESAEDRVAAGKDETGTVTLRAYHAAGNVVIELVDDGKGLNKEKILAKAKERGLLEAGRDMSEQDVFQLIFAPGFSTAEKITDVSGRGVGMDVVRRNIESLRGRIEVSSTLGEGSTFSIRLPLTMAITDAMILRVGEDRYLLPTVSIEQSFQPDAGSISTVTGQGEMVMLRGELLPLFRLHQLFQIEDAENDPYKGLLVVIEGDGRRCALMVDELLGQQQVVIKSLGQGMTKVAGIAGGAILGDGRVGLILDAAGLLQLAEGRVAASEAEALMV